MVLVKNVTVCLMVATHGYLVTGPVLSLNHRTGVCSAMVWGRLGTIFISGIVNYWKLRSDVARASSDPTGPPNYSEVLHRRPISARRPYSCRTASFSFVNFQNVSFLASNADPSLPYIICIARKGDFIRVSLNEIFFFRA